MKTESGKPNLFEYTSYRAYLAEVYRSRKESDRGFSHRQFARLAGFSSPNFLKLVIDGKRNLSPESVEKLSRALSFDTDHADFFRHLVLLNQAATPQERQHWADSLFQSRFFRKLQPLQHARHAYYSHWYTVAVRELVATEGFREDADWIARRLTPAISATEAKQAIETLLQLGLLKRVASGRLEQSDAIVTSGDEITSAALGQFHREMIRKGGESLDLFPPVSREVSAVTLGLGEASQLQVKTLIQRFRKDLLEIAAREQSPTQVVQINFQMFPLAQGESQSVSPAPAPAHDGDDDKEAA